MKTLLLFAAILWSISAGAALRYVDPNATGANNGTSWTDAWTSLSSGSGAGVSGGDTVYISGGRTYASTFTPKNGTSGHIITYQIGQESGHNGTATFTASSSDWPSTIPSYVYISGDAGDGLRHFKVNFSGGHGITPGAYGSYTSFHLTYVDFGTITGNSAMQLGDGNDFEFGYNFVFMAGNSVDSCLGIGDFQGGTNPANNKIHHNLIYTPTTTSDHAIGADGFQLSGDGWSMYNNVMISYELNTYSAGQHSDGWQTGGGQFIDIYNNVVLGYGDIGLYGGCWGNAVPGSGHYFCNIKYYNNIVDSITENAAGSIVVEADQALNSFFTNIVVYNNIARVGPTSSNKPGPYQFHSGDNSGTWNHNACTNNIAIVPTGNGWTGPIWVDAFANFPYSNNPTYTDSGASNIWVAFVAGATNNDYHLKSTATELIGKGTNFFSVFTSDIAGTSRPSSGAWDIGAYEYSSGGGSSPVSTATLGSGTLRVGIGTLRFGQ